MSVRCDRMVRRLRPAAAAVVLCALLAGCGGGKSAAPPTSSAAAPATTSPPANPQAFPVFRVAEDAAIDYLDPGLSYTTEGWSVMWNVYLPLLGYRHVSGPQGATIVPYLARSLPTVSADGKTYTLTLRKGLEYSNGQPVKASDFKATIERDFRLDSPGVGFFSDIVGAQQMATKERKHISGITVDDAARRITIQLKAPAADFVNVLATEFAAPVPASAPAKDTSTSPLPATGPYVIQSYRPSKQIVEVRNPHFDAAIFGGNVPAGNPDKVIWDIVPDAATALQRTIDGQDDWDPQPIPADKLAGVEEKYGSQVKVYEPPNTYYFFMNTRVAPFDKLQVRQAVNYAIDRQALVQIYDGLAVATENILPPADPQYRKHTFYPHDLAKARRLVRQAGAVGARVVVWNHAGGPDEKTTQYLVRVLNSIGLRAREHTVSSAVYWATIGNQSKKAQIGFADWIQDYPQPLDWFDVLLNGERITKVYNNNYANFDDPAVDATIAALRRQPALGPKVDARWAELDAAVMRQAPWAPFLSREFTDFFSARVDLGCYENHVLYEFDYATICVK